MYESCTSLVKFIAKYFILLTNGNVFLETLFSDCLLLVCGDAAELWLDLVSRDVAKLIYCIVFSLARFFKILHYFFNGEFSSWAHLSCGCGSFWCPVCAPDVGWCLAALKSCLCGSYPGAGVEETGELYLILWFLLNDRQAGS